jgi:hypothetical protein
MATPAGIMLEQFNFFLGTKRRLFQSYLEIVTQIRAALPSSTIARL